MTNIISEIKHEYRFRVNFLRSRNRVLLPMTALVRWEIVGDEYDGIYPDDMKEREHIRALAMEKVDQLCTYIEADYQKANDIKWRKKTPPPSLDGNDLALYLRLEPLLTSWFTLSQAERASTKKLEDLAAKLPIADWIVNSPAARGVGLLAPLATCLTTQPTPSCGSVLVWPSLVASGSKRKKMEN